jgi:hypothetical protein
MPREFNAETAFGWLVPDRFTANLPRCLSATVFDRRRLPLGYLCQRFLPIIVANEPLFYAMPLRSIRLRSVAVIDRL